MPAPLPNPFALLGLPERFGLSDHQIHQAYLAQVATSHPDTASPEAINADQTLQLDSALLNAAKSTLSNPESRANALLALHQGPSKETDRSLPDGFLIEIMELREAVENALSSDQPNAAATCITDAEHRRATHIESISHQFNDLSTPPTQSQLKSIRTELNAWRYIERLIEQLDPEYDPSRADFSS